MKKQVLLTIGAITLLMFGFQNCGKEVVSMKSDQSYSSVTTDGDSLVGMFQEQTFESAEKDVAAMTSSEIEEEQKQVVQEPMSAEMKALCDDLKKGDGIGADSKVRSLRRVALQYSRLSKYIEKGGDKAEKAKERLAAIKEKYPNIEADLDSIKENMKTVRKCRRHFFVERRKEMLAKFAEIRKQRKDGRANINKGVKSEKEKQVREIRQRSLTSYKDVAARIKASYEKRIAYMKIQLEKADAERKARIEKYIKQLEEHMAKHLARIDKRVAEMEKKMAAAN